MSWFAEIRESEWSKGDRGSLRMDVFVFVKKEAVKWLAPISCRSVNGWRCCAGNWILFAREGTRRYSLRFAEFVRSRLNTKRVWLVVDY